MKSSPSNVRNGFAALAFSRFGIQGLQLLAASILARILSPRDYGLAAIVLLVTQFAAIMADFGIASSVVQRVSPSDRYLSSAFWLNLSVVGVMGASVVALSAPLGRYYEQPGLTLMLLIGSGSLWLSFGGVHYALLQKDQRFKNIAGVQVIASLVGTVTTVALATLTGAGALSLVIGPVVERFITVILLFHFCRWRPRRVFSREDAAHIWSFGRGLTGFSLVSYWAGAADRVVISRVVGVPDLGFYNRAQNIVTVPVQQTSSVVGTVLFPILSAHQGNSQEFAKAYQRVLRLSIILSIQISVLLCISANFVVHVLYGSGWGVVAAVLPVLSAAVPATILVAGLRPVYEARARTGLQFRLGVVVAVLGLVFLAIGSRWGLLGVAWAVAARSWTDLGINALTVFRELRITWLQILRWVRGPVAASALMAGSYLLVCALAGRGRETLVVQGVAVALGSLLALGCTYVTDGAFVRAQFFRPSAIPRPSGDPQSEIGV